MPWSPVPASVTYVVVPKGTHLQLGGRRPPAAGWRPAMGQPGAAGRASQAAVPGRRPLCPGGVTYAVSSAPPGGRWRGAAGSSSSPDAPLDGGVCRGGFQPARGSLPESPAGCFPTPLLSKGTQPWSAGPGLRGGHVLHVLHSPRAAPEMSVTPGQYTRLPHEQRAQPPGP